MQQHSPTTAQGHCSHCCQKRPPAPPSLWPFLILFWGLCSLYGRWKGWW